MWDLLLAHKWLEPERKRFKVNTTLAGGNQNPHQLRLFSKLNDH